MAGAPFSDASVVLPPLLQQLRHFQCSARQRSRLHWLSSRGAANTRVAWSRRLSWVIRCSPSPLLSPGCHLAAATAHEPADGRGGPGELGDQRRGLGCGVRPCQTGRCCPHRLQSRRISAQPGDFTHQVRHARDVSPASAVTTSSTLPSSCPGRCEVAGAPYPQAASRWSPARLGGDGIGLAQGSPNAQVLVPLLARYASA